MRKTNCDEIRRQLDEAKLNDACSASVMLHLKQCAECQEFHQSRTKLRRLMGSLEPVGAPPDFDFRLRARLANEKAGSSYHLALSDWSHRLRVVAVVALISLFGAVVALNQWRRPRAKTSVAVKERPIQKETFSTTTQAEPLPAGTNEPKSLSETAHATGSAPAHGAPVKTSAPRSTSRKRMATMEFSNEPAAVVKRDETVASAVGPLTFPIGASRQFFQVSIDDGNGTFRTISLPTVSFGSQRVLASGNDSNRLAAKGIW